MTEQVLNVAVIIGFVNAVSFFFPEQAGDSRVKIALAFVGALFLTFVPVGPQVSGIIDLVFGSSGVYKVASKIGALR